MSRKFLGSLIIVIVLILSISCSGYAANTILDDSSGYPAGWDEHRYYAWIYEVWDSSVLPSCVPKEIEGVVVNETIHKARTHEALSSYPNVGRIEYTDSNYEYWGLSFDCYLPQLNMFLEELVANGFIGGMIDDYPLTYEYFGNGYYAHIRVNQNYFSDMDYYVVFEITSDLHEKAKSFLGVKLPQFGVAFYSFEDAYIWGYNEEFDYVEESYNYMTDEGILPKYFFAGFYYNATTLEEVLAYTASLVEDGCTMLYENMYDGYYYSELSKEGLFIRCIYEEYILEAEVAFANHQDLLAY